MSRREGGAYRRAGLTVALAFGALGVIPAIASAGSVSTVGTVITYTGDGNADTVTVDDAGVDTYTFAENGNTASGGCTLNTVPNPDVITCSGTNWTSVVMNMGNGSDTGNASSVDGTDDPADPFTMNGGSGNDNLTATSANDTINGGDDADTNGLGLSGGLGADTLLGGSGGDEMNGNAGNDTLTGEADMDTINGDADNDTLNGNAGQDDINGGTGTDRMEGGQDGDDFDGGDDIDRVLYVTGCSQGVTITVDNSANDIGCNGDSNENVRDSVESVTASTFGDAITGSCFANTFAGDPGSASGDAGGNDTLNGDPTGGCTAASGSTDFFGGGEGNDVFNGDGFINGTTHFRGRDTVTYGFPYTGHVTSTNVNCTVASVNYAVRVTFDDLGNDCDGFGNFSDNVNGDIERLIGSTNAVNPANNADNIDATAADQGVELFGGLGNDVLTDSTFGDYLNGEGGADTYNCPNGGTDTYVQDGSDTVNTAGTTCEVGM